jgi:hypothetical protein
MENLVTVIIISVHQIIVTGFLVMADKMDRMWRKMENAKTMKIVSLSNIAKAINVLTEKVKAGVLLMNNVYRTIALFTKNVKN